MRRARLVCKVLTKAPALPDRFFFALCSQRHGIGSSLSLGSVLPMSCFKILPSNLSETVPFLAYRIQKYTGSFHTQPIKEQSMVEGNDSSYSILKPTDRWVLSYAGHRQCPKQERNLEQGGVDSVGGGL